MVIAHTAPVGGVFNVTEYLTAPLFALLAGCSMVYAWDRSTATRPAFWFEQALRGLLLIGLGVLLPLTYAGIYDVLISLGLLTLLLPALVWLGRRRPAALILLLAVLAVAMPPLRVTGQAWLATHDPVMGILGPSTPVGQLVYWSVAHPTYRLPALAVAAGSGVLFAGPLASSRVRGQGLALGALACAAASGITVFVGKRLGWGGNPYDGTWPELAASTLIAVAALLACAWVWHTLTEQRRGLLAPLVATGRLALTCYTLQILGLAAFTRLTGSSDDHWGVLVGLTVALLAFASLWHQTLGPIRPAEWILRLPRRLTSSDRDRAIRSTA